MSATVLVQRRDTKSQSVSTSTVSSMEGTNSGCGAGGHPGWPSVANSAVTSVVSSGVAGGGECVVPSGPSLVVGEVGVGTLGSDEGGPSGTSPVAARDGDGRVGSGEGIGSSGSLLGVDGAGPFSTQAREAFRRVGQVRGGSGMVRSRGALRCGACRDAVSRRSNATRWRRRLLGGPGNGGSERRVQSRWGGRIGAVVKWICCTGQPAREGNALS